MRRILLPTDFSENAQRAIDYAFMLWGDEDIDFLLLNSFCLMHNIPEMLISLEDILREQSEKTLLAHVEQIKKEHQSVSIRSMSAYGEAPGVIKDVVREKAIDLVIMGSQGSTALGEVFLGSNTKRLINGISKPILIVPPQYPLKTPRKIVFGTDLIQVEDLDILQPMIHLTRKFQAEIIILNVTGNTDNQEVQGALQKLDFNNHFADINYRFDVVRNENVLDGILGFLHREKADMLVLLPKQYPNFKRLFHRSLTKKIVYRTDIPLLVV